MSYNENIIFPTECMNFNHSTTVYTFPPKVNCDGDPIGLFGDCQYMCNECNQGGATLPIPMDGEVMFQTQIRNATFADIVWSVIDEQGETIMTDLTSISTKVSGKNPPYQTIKFEVTNIPADCFSFKFVVDGKSYCSPIFEKEDCRRLIEIEGMYKDTDKWGNYYGENPVLMYSNKIYLRGTFRYYSPSYEDDIMSDVYRLQVSGFVNDVSLRFITGVVLSASRVKINGKEYHTTNNNNYNPVQYTNLFSPIFEVLKRTEPKGGKC